MICKTQSSCADVRSQVRTQGALVPLQRHRKTHPLRWLQEVALLILAIARHVLAGRRGAKDACTRNTVVHLASRGQVCVQLRGCRKGLRQRSTAQGSGDARISQFGPPQPYVPGAGNAGSSHTQLEVPGAVCPCPLHSAYHKQCQLARQVILSRPCFTLCVLFRGTCICAGE